MKSSSSVKGNGPLCIKGLASVLRNLKPIIRCYLEATDHKDNIWSYTERPWVGFLAGAAWRASNVIALEEFGTGKRHGTLKASYGRCDLWLGTRKTQCFIEAKWVNMQVESPDAPTKDALKKVRNSFSRACQAAREDEVCEDEPFPEWKQIGLCFVSPNFLNRVTYKSFQQLKDRLHREFGADLAAWFYSDVGFPDEGEQGPYRRGIFLLAREVKSRKR